MKSRYIPKPLVARVQTMETDKVSVEEILKVLKKEEIGIRNQAIVSSK